MKKLTIFILSFIFLFTSVFAYSPTSKDKSIVNSIGPIFANMVGTDLEEAKTYLSRLNGFSKQFQNSNPRYSYLFGALAEKISNAMENVVEEEVVVEVSARDREIEEIKERVKQERPNDYEMQEYEYKNQLEAYNNIAEFKNSRYTKMSILNSAINKRPNDYKMQEYEYENQLEAYGHIEELKESSSTNLSILNSAINERPNDYEMQEYEYKNQLESYKNLEESNDVETLSDGTRVYRNGICDHTYYRGPRGGCYYINGNGNKTYDTSKVCCSGN